MKDRRGVVRRSLLSLSVITLMVFCWCARNEPSPVRVLFIGNSYTYFNNLPEIFAALARSGGRGNVETAMVAPGGWRLKDHWEKGDARLLLRNEKWDFVVLQDQSLLGKYYYLEGQPRVSTDENFRSVAYDWAKLIQQMGAIPVFYLTWARKATPEDQAALNYAYINAARMTNAKVAPVGIAWILALGQRPEIELYSDDGSHPSPAGSYLAACTIYATVFGQNPKGLPAKINGHPVNRGTAKVELDKTHVLVDLPPAQARILQKAAWASRQRLDENGGYIDVSPVLAPSLSPLPEGEALSTLALEGTWTGEIKFYDVGPVRMVLDLRREGGIWKGHLELKYDSKDLSDESFDLEDLKVDERAFTFSIPKSPWADDLRVSFRAVCPAPDEMRGIAEASRRSVDQDIHALGTWRLHKAPSVAVLLYGWRDPQARGLGFRPAYLLCLDE